MSKSLYGMLLAGGLLLSATPAHGDARAELLAAFGQTFAPGRQLRAEMLSESGGEQVRMSTEMVLPDRFRTRNDRGEFLILPEGAWMRVAGSEQWQAFQINPASMSAAYTAEGFRRMRDEMGTVRQIDGETLAGKPVKRYAWHADSEYMGLRSSNDLVAWVESGCRCIVRLDTTASSDGKTGTTRIDYTVVSGLELKPPAGIQ